SARAIIFDQARNRVLVERNGLAENAYFNFIGGAVEIEETLQECIARELEEETDAIITAARYLFVIENFISHKAQVRHSLEHYFEIELAGETVAPTTAGVEFRWIAIDELRKIDLRPAVVRDSIVDGTYARTRHMILRKNKKVER
ncbi:MAG TPA: NUDIX domain-containing protein, partial [Candidatus Sulfomarinibacteraceae bacterium]|nr:NUDIX domain-containing protein [Candidatus Sulfomarinibacteraceae bacterium]